MTFSYTPASQIASTTRSNDAFAWTGHYNVSRSYTANGLNQYATAGSVTPTYDARGNMTYEGTRTFAFDSENRLTSASGGVTLAYDPSGRLYQTAGAATTKFAYDGADLIAEYNASNQLQRRYVHGPGSDEPLVWYEGSGTADRRFLHSDERGSVVAITNGSGTVTNVNSYDEYGVPAAANVGRFQYTGQAWLTEIGMYHYKARIYWPQGGRFLQTDPIGYGDGMNLYAYVGGDPVNWVDPSGLSVDGDLDPPQEDQCIDPCSVILVTAITKPGTGKSGPTGWGRKVGGGGGGGGGGWGGGKSPKQPEDKLCPPVEFTVTGVGPNQANSDAETAISQEPGNRIDPRAGGVAIKPRNFGVSSSGGGRRGVFSNIRLYADWGSAQGPSYVPAVPPGLPSMGPYRPIDNIGPRSVRESPGNHIDLYRYRDQKQAFASTRKVKIRALIPPNKEGVVCPK